MYIFVSANWRSGKSRVRGDPEHPVRFPIAPNLFSFGKKTSIRKVGSVRWKHDTSAGECGTLVAY